VTLRAFWRLLLQGTEAGPMSMLATVCWVASGGAIAGLLGWAAWRHRKVATPQGRDLFVAATVASMPLLMPFYFDYDLLLLGVSVVLYANVRLRQPAAEGTSAADRWLTGMIVALYGWLMVNSIVARYTHVNGTVILLSGVAAILLWRAARARGTAILTLTPPDAEFEPAPLATAA
jgi:hypothetical protein